jgi:hypothetical protein
MTPEASLTMISRRLIKSESVWRWKCVVLVRMRRQRVLVLKKLGH